MKNFNILVIDDDPGIRSNIIRFLDRIISSFQFFEACNKTEALNLMKEKDFDLITLDGRLLDNDHGRDVLKEMSEDQISKTIVYSAESKFIEECRTKGIRAAEKDCYTIDKLIAVEDGLIVFKI
ncbi:MAG TPA: response regulator [bacterium]|nr:response regulator [bacterium]HPV65053.1 response regulator [bacterium]